MDHEDDDPGTTWNADARKREPDRMSARQAWRAIQAGLPKNAIISSDIGNNCAIGNAYPTFDEGRKYLAPGLFGPCGYGFPVIIGAKIGNPDIPCVGFAGDGAFGISMSEMSSIGRDEYPGITMVVFRNYQWGAEKRNSILWFDNNFVGTELDPHLSYAKVAEGCGLKGVTVKTQAELTEALRASCEAAGKTTQFAVFQRYDLDDSPDVRPTYAQLASELAIPVTQVTNYLAFARRELRRLVLERLRSLCATDEEFRLEARELLGADPTSRPA